MITLAITAHGAEAKEASSTTDIKFTRFLAGSGAANVSDESAVLKVQKVEQEIPVTSITKSIESSGTKVVLKGAGNSDDVKSTYMLSELGLYAKLGDGDEFCFAYGVESGEKFAVNPLYDMAMSISSTFEFPMMAYSRIDAKVYEAPVTMEDLSTHIKATVGATPIHGINRVGSSVVVGGVSLATASSIPDLKVAKTLMASGSTSALLTVDNFTASSPYMVMCTGGDASGITTSLSTSGTMGMFEFTKTENTSDTTIAVIYSSALSSAGDDDPPSPGPSAS